MSENKHTINDQRELGDAAFEFRMLAKFIHGSDMKMLSERQRSMVTAAIDNYRDVNQFHLDTDATVYIRLGRYTTILNIGVIAPWD
jgi:hypothetical protein